MAAFKNRDGDGGAVLCGCSICPFVGLYPGEIRYCNDGLFRCNRYCNDPHTKVDYDNMRKGAPKRDDAAPRFRVGPIPDYYDS